MSDGISKVTRTYSFEDHTIALGTAIVTEFEDGDAVTLSLDGVDWETTQGSHGSIVRSKKYNYLGKAVFKLMQGSPVNKLLADLHRADLESGTGTMSLMIRDNRGQTEASAPACYFEKTPDLPLGAKSGSIEWTLICPHLEIKHDAAQSS